MLTARIEFLHPRGFGFLRTDEGQQLFFCASVVDKDSGRPFNELRVGDTVSVGTIQRGDAAQHVRWLADGEEDAA